MRKNKKYTVYSLFTGAGGFDIGFEEAGFEIIGASDIWKESEKTMSLNFPDVPFICKDIRLLSSKEILKSTKGKYPDVIIGGPPCQGFSVMGDKNSADPRNSLFESYARLVDDLKPTCFVFENVKGIKTMFNGRYLKMVANSFAELGYDIHLKVLNSKDQTESSLFFKLKNNGTRVYTNIELKNDLKYKSTPTENMYLVYQLLEECEKEFLGLNIDLSKIQGLGAIKRPIAISIEKLLKSKIK